MHVAGKMPRCGTGEEGAPIKWGGAVGKPQWLLFQAYKRKNKRTFGTWMHNHLLRMEPGLSQTPIDSVCCLSGGRWELKRLTKEAAEGEEPIDDDADMEALKRNLEEDPELRKSVNMYRLAAGGFWLNLSTYCVGSIISVYDIICSSNFKNLYPEHPQTLMRTSDLPRSARNVGSQLSGQLRRRSKAVKRRQMKMRIVIPTRRRPDSDAPQDDSDPQSHCHHLPRQIKMIIRMYMILK